MTDLIPIESARWPSDPQTERALLGACMLDPYALVEVSDQLRHDDLHLSSHREIWKHIQAVSAKGSHPDSAILCGRLMDQDQATRNACGGMEYVQGLPEHTPSSNGWPHYLARVRELATRRRLLMAADHLSSEARTTDDLDKLQADTERMLDAAEVSQTRPMMADEVAAATWTTIEARMAAKEQGQVMGLPTSLPDLDAAIGSSLRPGKLVILAARPAMGKSAMAMQWAMTAADHNHGAAFISLEMPATDLMVRAWASRANVPLPNLEHGNLNASQLERLEDAHRWAHHLPLSVCDDADVSIGGIRAATRRSQKQLQQRGVPLALVVVDYLQLVNLQQGRGQTKADAVGAVSRGLKVMAKELGVCVVCLSQLNRKCEDRTNKRPQIADLRDSGAIEQDADLVLFVYRDEVYYGPESKFPGQAELIIAKQRSGALGTVTTEWEVQYTRFLPFRRRYT